MICIEAFTGLATNNWLRKYLTEPYRGPPRLFIRHTFDSLTHNRPPLQVFPTTELLHWIFFDVPGHAIAFPSSVRLVAFAASWANVYINILSLYEFHHVLPSNWGNLRVKLGWGFFFEPRPLKPPCLAERGWVVGGTGVLCLDSWFVLFIYSLIFFWIRFFSSLKEFFPDRPKKKIIKNNKYIYFFYIYYLLHIYIIIYKINI